MQRRRLLAAVHEALARTPIGFLGAALAIGLLAGCDTLETPATNAMTATLRLAVVPGSPVDRAELVPDIGYLRVTLNGAVALFALAFIDADQNGPIQVYYGPGREVLRLQRGQLLGFVGAPVSWRSVSLSANPPVSNGDVAFTRHRDVAPGERYDLIDTVAIRDGASKEGQLQGLDATALRWYDAVTSDLPPAKIALDASGTAVYGEQCLDGENCLTWQLWPPASRAAP
jgi:hypothetical protein